MKRRSCGGGGLQKQLAAEAEIEGMLEQFKKKRHVGDKAIGCMEGNQLMNQLVLMDWVLILTLWPA